MNPFEETIANMQTSLNNTGSRYWITASTLLHLHRDNTLETRTLDFDVDPIDEKGLKDFFSTANKANLRNENMITFHYPMKVEIHILRFCKRWAYREPQKGKYLIWPRYHYDEPEEVEIAGMSLPIPGDTEKYLEIYYGDWNNPQEFHWTRDAQNLLEPKK